MHSLAMTQYILQAALKEVLIGIEHELGLYVAGGRGITSRRAPTEVTKFGNAMLLL